MKDPGLFLASQLDTLWVINHQTGGPVTGAADGLAILAVADGREVNLAGDFPGYGAAVAATLDRHCWWAGGGRGANVVERGFSCSLKM